MSVEGPPVSLVQAAQEFNVSPPTLSAVRTAAGLPAAGGLLELAGMSSMQSYHDVPIFTFGADADKEAYWVFNMNAPGSSGYSGANGFVGSTEYWYDANIVTPQLFNSLGSYPYLTFTLEQTDGSWRASGTVTQYPNASNGWVMRVTQNDWASGAGWSRYRILLYADRTAKPVSWTISPQSADYYWENYITITPIGGHAPYLMEVVIPDYPGGATFSSGWTNSAWTAQLMLDYTDTTYPGYIKLTDSVGQVLQHNFTYHDMA